jgi:hypothetical protein
MKKEWTIKEHSWSDTSIYDGDRCVCRLSIYDKATEENQQALEKLMDAEAKLIAKAPKLQAERDLALHLLGNLIEEIRISGLRYAIKNIDQFEEALNNLK